MHKELANAIRFLSIDAVEAAKSGHPGMPMGMADIAVALWKYNLKHNPQNPTWFNRDRFVLSNGHGSMLLYSLLHLTGYELSIEDLKNFRQLGSKTPGHPEFDIDIGVETTTGPLGQGIGNAVGMALAEKMLASRFNQDDGLKPIDHFTYTFLGDGCLMEGVSHEACSFAGTHGLGKLICFYDQNGISIDGEITNWFTDNTLQRFESYGWQVLEVDGHNVKETLEAIRTAQQDAERPTLICCKTIIGFGSPNKSGTSGVHGAALGEDEVKKTRDELGWEHEPFHIPDDIKSEWDCKDEGAKLNSSWDQLMMEYSKKHPKSFDELTRVINNELPINFENSYRDFINELSAGDQKDLATRKASELCLNYFCEKLPELIGGSADLTGSNNTFSSVSTEMLPDNPKGNHIFYGVREFGMTAMTNGMVLDGGIKPYSGTFLVFMDYARNAVRLAALMKIPNIFVYTHDSVAVGEDGPTHQPVEQLANLRTTPNLATWRPCDTVETAVAWKSAVASRSMPTALVFTRQKVAAQARSKEAFANLERGGYVLYESDQSPQVLLIATGSEVAITMAAAQSLSAQGLAARVVSMPCVEVFEMQDAAYKEAVLPAAVRARVAVEAGHPDIWFKYVGLDGAVVGIDRFGMSAPGAQALETLGMTTERIVASALTVAGK